MSMMESARIDVIPAQIVTISVNVCMLPPFHVFILLLEILAGLATRLRCDLQVLPNCYRLSIDQLTKTGLEFRSPMEYCQIHQLV